MKQNSYLTPDKEYSQDSQDYSEWIEQIWSEKRGRPVTNGEEEYTLAVGLKEPTYDVSTIIDGVLEGLNSVEPQFAYEWSKRWGQARIALSPNGTHQWKFVNIRSNESKKYSPIFTEMKLPPSEMMFDSRPEQETDGSTLILINDSEPVTMEGAVLQIERMVDELVWSTSHDLETTQGMGKEDAYTLALQSIQSRGVAVRYASASAILDIKKRNPSAWVRLYGDVHKQSTIPQVIGLVCNGEFARDDGIIARKNVDDAELNPVPGGKVVGGTDPERSGNVNELYTFATSFTAGKRPHIGHLFLLSRINAVAHSIQQPVEVKIEINDTGERFEALVDIAKNSTGLAEQDIIDGINDGTFSLEQVEQWYTQRSAADKKSMYYVPPKSPTLRMSSQLDEIIDSIKPIIGTTSLQGVLSSSFDYTRVLDAADPAWRGTGYEVIRGRVLSKRGGATPFLTRLGFIDSISDKSNGIIYVDSSNEIADAVRVSKESVDNEMHCIPGAGVGFDFCIHSGSKAVSELTIDAVLQWYTGSVADDSGQLVKDVNFLTARLPMHKPVDNAESYYNFKNLEAFQEQLLRSHSDRMKLIRVLQDIRMIMPTSAGTQFKDGVTRAMKTEVNKIVGTYARQDVAHHGQSTRIRTHTPILVEGSDLLKKVHADPELGEIKDQTQKILHYLRKSLNNGEEVESATLEALRSEGYKTNDELLEALNKLVDFRHVLKLQITPSQLMINNVIKVLESVTSLAQDDSDDFYALCAVVLEYLGGEDDV